MAVAAAAGDVGGTYCMVLERSLKTSLRPPRKKRFDLQRLSTNPPLYYAPERTTARRRPPSVGRRREMNLCSEST